MIRPKPSIPRSNNRIRVQLQTGHHHIFGFKRDGISAQLARSGLQELYIHGSSHKHDEEWQVAFGAAIERAKAWVGRVEQAGGLRPHGSGTVHSVPFRYGRKEYRIDIEAHGTKDVDWFGKST